MQKTPLAALVTAEIVSILGSRMTYLALPWFVLVTTGSPAKMSARPRRRDRCRWRSSASRAARSSSASGHARPCSSATAARAPLLASIPLLHAAGMLSFPLLLALVMGSLGCFMAPYMAAQRVILPEVVGEDERLP